MEPLGSGDPRTVGPYRLTYRLGSGGMGRVYLGESPGGRRVAVKLVREDLASSDGFRERFRREVKLAMRAGGFWTAQVVDADPDAAVPWIASQYVEGPSLAERVARQGPLDERELRRIGGGLAEALASFHKAGLVHRDLKPSNVLLQKDGPRVIDFGVSKALESLDTSGAITLTRAGTILGTPGFMAPEQALGKPAGPPADVFSLGSLLVHAATGSPPFGTGASHALLYRVVYEEPELGGVPYGLRQLITDCLRKNPEDRPTAEALVPWLAGLGPRGLPDPRVAVAADVPARAGGPGDAPTDAPTDGPTDAPTGAPTDVPAEASTPGALPAEAPTGAIGGVPAGVAAGATAGVTAGATTSGPQAADAEVTGRVAPVASWLRRAETLRKGMTRAGGLTGGLTGALLRPVRRLLGTRTASSPKRATADIGDGGFAVGEWGSKVFWRRMRSPLRLALGIDLLTFASETAHGQIRPAAFGIAFLATLACVLSGLKAALPLRRPNALRVGPDGLYVRRGAHQLTIPWREIASVGFARRGGRRLALTAKLKPSAGTAVPGPLTGDEGALTCTVSLPLRREVAAHALGLDTALRTYARDRYPAGQGPTG